MIGLNGKPKERQVFILLCVVTVILTGWLTGTLAKGTGDGAVMHMVIGFGSVLAAAILMRAAGLANRAGVYCGPGVVTASAGAMTFAATRISANRHYACNLTV